MNKLTPEQSDFWTEFCAATGQTGDPVTVDAFGDSEALKDELLQLVLIGRKRATCTLLRAFSDHNLPIPKPGDRHLITDGREAPAAVIETTHVHIAPVISVTDEFAFEEGEGDRTRESWLSDHRAFFRREAEREGFTYSDDMDAVFERFRLVWPV